ncbi:MAG TPA: putative sulfate exporter family transporter [Methylomirabilota bacterium]|nr:putative sulfate exporter family transporter [Methylomirabilota bacterium]
MAGDAENRVLMEASFDSMEGIERSAPPQPAGFLGRLPRARLVAAVYPGVLTAATIALAATWLSQHYATPVMLFALLLGMAFHFLHEGGRCVAGIEFCARTVLRLGVALLGVRVTLSEISGLGLGPVLTVVAGVATTILVGVAVARAMGLKPWFGLLSGGSVAICGASAALAIASVLPDRVRNDSETILTVVTVTALSTVAMVVYPVLVAALGLDRVEAGIFLGGTIHDVAQVVGAGYMVSNETGDVATYVKLLRVAMLLPVVLAIGIVVARVGAAGGAAARVGLPLFLVGFVVLMMINSAGLIPPAAVDGISEVSRWCLVTAIAALGMKTSFKTVFSVGWRPIALMVVETAWIAALVLASVLLLG